MTETSEPKNLLQSLRDEYVSIAKQLEIGGLLTEDVIALHARQEEILMLAGKHMIVETP